MTADEDGEREVSEPKNLSKALAMPVCEGHEGQKSNN